MMADLASNRVVYCCVGAVSLALAVLVVSTSLLIVSVDKLHDEIREDLVHLKVIVLL